MLSRALRAPLMRFRPSTLVRHTSVSSDSSTSVSSYASTSVSSGASSDYSSYASSDYSSEYSSTASTDYSEESSLADSEYSEDSDEGIVDPDAVLMQRKYYATGRRKTSAARVFLTVGSGQFTVNNRPLHQYFQPIQRQDCLEPFLVSKTAGIFDVYCTVKGGGMSGQAGAVRLGISRALQIFEPELRGHLKKVGFLERDSRRVERKKPGLKKARKQYQWVKR